MSNFMWLIEHGFALAAEYTHRYNKTHKSLEVIKWCYLNAVKLNINKIKQKSNFALAMPNKYKIKSGGRKSPARITIWEKKFSRKLKKHHKHFAKKVFHRLMKKSSTLRSTLKRRSKEYEVEFNISLEEVRNLLYQVYGKRCAYCKVRLVVNNMACDHILPLSM